MERVRQLRLRSKCHARGYGGIAAGIKDFVTLQAFNGERHISSKLLQRKAEDPESDPEQTRECVL